MSNKTTIGLKVSHERNARIQRKVDDAGYQSRQAYIRDLIDDDLGGFDTTVESATTQHTPEDRRDAEIYDALLDHIPLEGWTRFGRFKGDIAQSTSVPTVTGRSTSSIPTCTPPDQTARQSVDRRASYDAAMPTDTASPARGKRAPARDSGDSHTGVG